MSFGYSFLQSNSLLERAIYGFWNGEIRIAGTDWILIGGDTFRSFIKGINNTLGTEAVGILLEAGECAGQDFAQSLLKEGTLPEEVPSWLEVLFTQGGWGKITARADFVNKTAVVVIDNCATARQTTTKEASCHFIRGYVAGTTQILFEVKTECVEAVCMPKGEPCCEFRVKSQTHLPSSPNCALQRAKSKLPVGEIS